MLIILGVENGGLGDEMGIEEGDQIVSLGSNEINDSIDFAYYFTNCIDSTGVVNIEVKKPDGQLIEIEAELDEDDDLGLDFPPLEAAKCKNKCIFCFVHQLPKGLRSSLSVKDEDFRFSFLSGNYVTLAQVERDEIERIITQRLSPIYISVHSTNPEIRTTLLGMKPKWEIVSLMTELADAGIEMHAQIVVCPGINDGESLKESIKDLYCLYPSLLSLAVVPVGLTSHREKLTILRPIGREDAIKTISLVTALQKQLKMEGNTSFVFLADEYYLKAEVEIPPYSHYEDFPQLENGVGLLASFKKEADDLFNDENPINNLPEISVVTGHSPFKYIDEFVSRLRMELGIQVNLFVVNNEMLGDTVTVTGLISGGDIVRQLNGKALGKILLIPNVALKDGDGKFLDDMNLDDVGKALNIEVLSFDSTPTGFFDVISTLVN